MKQYAFKKNFFLQPFKSKAQNDVAEHQFATKSCKNVKIILTPVVLENTDELLAGIAQSNVKIIVTVNGEEYQTTVDETGHWSMVNPIVPGTFGSIIARDTAGNSSEPIILAKILPSEDQIVLDAPIILEYGTILAGTAVANSIIIVRSNEIEYRTVTDAEGNWRLENPIAHGGVLSIVVEDQYGLRSPEIMFAKAYEPELPEIPEYMLSTPVVMTNADKLAGQADPNVKIIVTVNTQEYVTTADATGFWQMDNPIQQGGFASIVAEDTYGVRSEEVGIAKLVSLTPEPESDLSEVLVVSIEDSHQSPTEEIQIALNIDALLNPPVPQEIALSLVIENDIVTDSQTTQEMSQALPIFFETNTLVLEPIQTYWVA